MLLDLLEDEVRFLQEKYKLSNCYILESSQKAGAYHVICLDHLQPVEWINLLRDTNTDQNYQQMPIYSDNRAWVLRVAPKDKSIAPKYLKTIESKYQTRTKSLAHALFLANHYKIPINNLKNLDKNTKLLYINYSTMSYISKDEKKNDKKMRRLSA